MINYHFSFPLISGAEDVGFLNSLNGRLTIKIGDLGVGTKHEKNL